jgi:DNA polymerase III delta prime subunit
MAQGLIGLVGLQGSGKTTALQFLAAEINASGKKDKKAFLIHWTPDALTVLTRIPEIHEEYVKRAYERAAEKAEGYAYAGKRLAGKIPTLVTLGRLADRTKPLEEVEVMLGTGECERLKRQVVLSYLSTIRYLFIDLPDYSKRNRGDMTRDLRAIETLWKTLQYGEYEIYQIIVLGIQKEMFGGHFFFGKMDIVEIPPFKPTEMVEAYKQKWQAINNGLYIITEDALLQIAELSRGVFRRFLKYLQRCIEANFTAKKPFPVTADTVKAAITFEQVAKDMDLELAEMFKTKEQKFLSVKLLDILRKRGELSQKQAAEELNINEMAISRLIRALEVNGYLKRRRGDRKKWLITLS